MLSNRDIIVLQWITELAYELVIDVDCDLADGKIIIHYTLEDWNDDILNEIESFIQILNKNSTSRNNYNYYIDFLTVTIDLQ